MEKLTYQLIRSARKTISLQITQDGELLVRAPERIGRGEIDRFVEDWNNSDDPCTLREYLGLNAEEEDVWIEESDEALQEMLDAQKKK